MIYFEYILLYLELIQLVIRYDVISAVRIKPCPQRMIEDKRVARCQAIDGTCYQLMHNTKKSSWMQAQTVCNELQSNLPSFRDEQQYEHFIEMRKYLSTPEDEILPIGLHFDDIRYDKLLGDHKIGWRWVDGTPVRYTKWAKGHPQTNINAKYAFDNGSWFVSETAEFSKLFYCQQDCDNQCHKECSGSCPKPCDPLDITCIDARDECTEYVTSLGESTLSSYYDRTTCSCFVLVKDKRNFTAAEEYCRYGGGRLAWLCSEELVDRVKVGLGKRDIERKLHPYIGARRIGIEHDKHSQGWGWHDVSTKRSCVATGHLSIPWAMGEPNNNAKEECTTLCERKGKDRNGLINDSKCHLKLAFVCERPHREN